MYRKDIGPHIATILENICVSVTFGSIKRAQYTSLQHLLLVILRELTTSITYTKLEPFLRFFNSWSQGLNMVQNHKFWIRSWVYQQLTLKWTSFKRLHSLGFYPWINYIMLTDFVKNARGGVVRKISAWCLFTFSHYLCFRHFWEHITWSSHLDATLALCFIKDATTSDCIQQITAVCLIF